MKVVTISTAVLVLGLVSVVRVPGQVSNKPQSTPKPYVNHGKFLNLNVETRDFQAEMPLARFLQVLEKQLPKEPKIKLRIDAEAFGDDFCEVANTKIRFPEHPKRMQLGTALRLAKSKILPETDYRLGESEFVLTTPQRALYTAIHDIAGIKADRILQMQASSGSTDFPSIQVLNGTRLVIRTNEDGHTGADNLVQALRRLNDLQVILQTRLYEVDDVFYQKLKNMKRIPFEEEEKDLLDGRPSPWEPLFKLLKKQKLVQRGEEIKVGDGAKPVLLSRQKVMTCLPKWEPFRKEAKGRQTILLGVSFQGKIHVSPDRRSVQVNLTEKATELQEIKQTKMPVLAGAPRVIGETPFLNVTTRAQVLEIPDGGTILVPIQVRTLDLPKDRFWVLAISPRIRIEEEERYIEKEALGEILPALAADVLKHSRLKTLREFHGSPGDKRFALVDSPAWTWTKEDSPAIAGFQLTPAQRTGKRLLGIRIDKYQWKQDGDYASYAITVSLVNAGGADNGPAIGSGTIRYMARSGEKGWSIKLAEPSERNSP